MIKLILFSGLIWIEFHTFDTMEECQTNAARIVNDFKVEAWCCNSVTCEGEE